MSLFWCYKFLRRDARHWIPVEGLFSYISTFLCRILTKTVVDFTLIIQFRHPFDLGGLYWTMNMVMNQLFCFVSIYIYETFGEDTNEDMVLLLWKIVGGLFVFSMLNFVLFLRLIKREYWATFFTTITGFQYVVNNYKEAKTDELKFEVFGHNRNLYDSIQEDIMKWLNENWETWVESSPKWFTPAAISTVPSDLLPKKALSDMGGVTGRKASIIKMKEEKGKDARESVRRGSNLKVIPMGYKERGIFGF